MANHMDSMIAMIVELSQKVHGQDKAAVEQTGIPLIIKSIMTQAGKKEGQTSGLRCMPRTSTWTR